MPVWGFQDLELILSLRTLGCLGLSVSVLQESRIELFTSLFDGLCLAFPLSPQSMVRSGFHVFALDFGHADLTLFLRSFACLDPVTSALRLSSFGSTIPSRSLVRPELVPFTPGVPQVEFHLPLLDASSIEPLLPLQSPACLGLALFALRADHLDSTIFIRSFACPDSAAPVLGVVTVSFALSLFDYTYVDSSPSSQSSAQPDLSISIVDYNAFESLLLPHSFGHPDLLLFVLGLSHIGLFMLLRQHA